MHALSFIEWRGSEYLRFDIYSFTAAFALYGTNALASN